MIQLIYFIVSIIKIFFNLQYCIMEKQILVQNYQWKMLPKKVLFVLRVITQWHRPCARDLQSNDTLLTLVMLLGKWWLLLITWLQMTLLQVTLLKVVIVVVVSDVTWSHGQMVNVTVSDGDLQVTITCLITLLFREVTSTWPKPLCTYLKVEQQHFFSFQKLKSHKEKKGRFA